jgi:O-antigen/teichoic acid export membrane protein
VMAVVLVIAAPQAIPLLFGDAFRPAVPVVQTMVLAVPLLCFVNALLTTIYSGGFERRVMAGIAVAMGNGTLVLAAGAAIDGAQGAAVGYLVRACLVTLAVTRTTRRSVRTVP